MPLINTLPTIRGTYRENALLSKTNWFGVGGPADVLFRPADADDLCDFLQEKPDDIPVTVIGVGSNLLVRDGGVRGVVIRLGKGFTHATINGSTLIAGAGGLCFNAAQLACNYAVGGLEFLCGIPGSIGGALAMNAGAYGSDVSSVLVEAKAVDEAGQLHVLNPSDIGYVYRGHTLPDGMFFVEGTFKGIAGDREAIAAKMQEITHARESTQPSKSRTSGSTFKNPPEHKAWQLIDEAGCRGLTIGGAQVSEKHCNFFLNTGNATAEDFETLIETVKTRVFENSGVHLQSEIKILGEKG
jgi:UDP-N-acetylmuramate dehydrogenase